MLRGFFGNLIFAIIAQMLCGNHLNCLSFLQFRGKENCDSLLHEDLLTIDMETVATLREEEEGSTVPPTQARGCTIGLAGCGIWLSFAVIFGI